MSIFAGYELALFAFVALVCTVVIVGLGEYVKRKDKGDSTPPPSVDERRA